MKIIFIGAGAVATNLSKIFFRKGNQILQIVSQSASSASALAREFTCSFSTNFSEIIVEADIYFICVKDNVLEKVIHELPPLKGILVHTSGSISIKILTNKFEKCGVFYPLQSFSKFRKVDLSSSPVFIESNQEMVTKQIEALAKQITDKVYFINSEQRMALHICGIFAGNFSNHMYTLAHYLSKKYNLSFDLLFPLIEETAEKIKHRAPSTSQTGPAVRKDQNILDLHKRFLSDEPDLLKIYDIITESIIKFSHYTSNH